MSSIRRAAGDVMQPGQSRGMRLAVSASMGSIAAASPSSKLMSAIVSWPAKSAAMRGTLSKSPVTARTKSSKADAESSNTMTSDTIAITVRRLCQPTLSSPTSIASHRR